MRVNQAFSGFIASEPRITPTKDGQVRLYASVGQRHFGPPDEYGRQVELERTYHNLVIFGDPAQEAFERFRKGDEFIAEGEVQTYKKRTPDGRTEDNEVFRAMRIGHNTARTTYAVDRTHRPDLRRHRQQGQTVEPTRHELQQDPSGRLQVTAPRTQPTPSGRPYVQGPA